MTEDRITVSRKGWIELNAKIQEANTLLKKAKAAIDHARKWRVNADPEFEDNGMYRKISNEIEAALK